MPGFTGSAASGRLRIKGALCGLAYTSGNLNQVMPGLEKHQHRAGRGTRADRADATAGETYFQRTFRPVVAF
jgi:hypothetical protein